MLIAEFVDHHDVESAAIRLKQEGVDMSKVNIHGADWADDVAHKTPHTVLQSIGLGMAIGLVPCLIGGCIVGLSQMIRGDISTAQGWQTFIAAAIATGIGMIVAAFIGLIYGAVSARQDMPAWVAPEYGYDLEKGAHLLLVHGKPELLDTARKLLEPVQPLSLRFHE